MHENHRGTNLSSSIANITDPSAPLFIRGEGREQKSFTRFECDPEGLDWKVELLHTCLGFRVKTGRICFTAAIPVERNTLKLHF